MKNLYLVLALVGTVIPYYEFIQYLSIGGFDMSTFLSQMFSNHISSFFALDVIISALVLFLFIYSENKKHKIKKYYFAIVGTLVVGVSLGFPLFLYLREISIRNSL